MGLVLIGPLFKKTREKPALIFSMSQIVRRAKNQIFYSEMLFVNHGA